MAIYTRSLQNQITCCRRWKSKCTVRYAPLCKTDSCLRKMADRKKNVNKWMVLLNPLKLLSHNCSPLSYCCYACRASRSSLAHVQFTVIRVTEADQRSFPCAVVHHRHLHMRSSMSRLQTLSVADFLMVLTACKMVINVHLTATYMTVMLKDWLKLHVRQKVSTLISRWTMCKTWKQTALLMYCSVELVCPSMMRKNML